MTPRLLSRSVLPFLLSSWLACSGGDVLSETFEETELDLTTLATVEGESLALAADKGAVITTAGASGGKVLRITRSSTATGQVLLPSAVDTVVVRARAELCEGGPRMVVRSNATVLLDVTVSSTSWASFTAKLPAAMTGTQPLSVEFPNDHFRSSSCDRNLRIDYLRLGTEASVQLVGNVQLDRATIAPGQTLTGKVTYKNSSAQALTLASVVIAARPPGGTHAGGPYQDLAPSQGLTVLQPGQSITVTATRAFTAADPVGQWETYSTWKDASGTWSDGPSTFFTVGATSTPPPAEPTPTPPTPTPPVANANVQIDFGVSGRPTSNLSVGSCISTYADGGTNLIKGAQTTLWKRYLSELGPMAWRIPLYFHGGQVGSAAGGVHGGNEGAAYINAIKSIGGTPIIAVGGTTNDNDISATDAANLVRYFNDGGGANGGPVDYFIIGNEPDNGFGVGNYTNGGAGNSGFANIVSAMRGATSRRLFVAGPALTSWADYKYGDYRSFFQSANPYVDIVDFHKYGDGQRYDNLNRTGQYEDAVRWLRTEVQSAFGSRAGEIAIQLGEFNYHPFYAGWQDTFFTSRNLVHTASVVGHMLKEGGRAYHYADSNGPLGLISDGTGNNGQPAGQHVRLPAYWGLSAWTGGVWTRRYGTVMVQATTTLPDFEVFATNNAKKIVLINKSTNTDRTAVLELKGLSSGSYSAWSYGRGMDPAAFGGPQFQPPTRIADGAAYSGGQVQIQVPWMSVVVLTID